MALIPTRAFVAPATFVDPASPAALLRVHEGVPFAQVLDALTALTQIPYADRVLLAQHGLQVDLLDAARVEGNTVGLTKVTTLMDGSLRPESIQVAAIANQSDRPTRQIVAHEIGHAISAMRSGDESELAAERYCAAVLRSPEDQAIAATRMRKEGMEPVASTLGAEIAAAGAKLLG